MNLSLVIPVYNDQANLDRLLQQVRALRIFDQIIVVDDASDEPVVVSDDVELLRREESGGAGAARNMAMPVIRTDHVLFFDSDDLLTPEFADLWQDVQGQTFDFCLFRYQDSARDFFGGWGQDPKDELLWKQSGALYEPLRETSGLDLWRLAEASNFPWNKLYRTEFLRAHNLRCSETAVHNDIELHWRSFIAAKQVLTSNRICAYHVVRTDGGRLTNRAGRERLQVFDALSVVPPLMSESDLPIEAKLTFWRFASFLLIWVEGILEQTLLAEFHAEMRRFIMKHLPPQKFDHIIKKDPVLALQLCLQMAGGREGNPVPC